MVKKYPIEGNNIYLDEMKFSFIGKTYLSWMNDKTVNQFLESSFQRWTIIKLKQYISEITIDLHNLFLAIVLKNGNKHIGNIKIGPINTFHKFADLGLVIGDKSEWGKGYGTEAINLATDYAFQKLKLHKMSAGVYANNIASYKAFIKAGYAKIGIMKKHRLYKGKYVDEIIVEKINDKTS